MKMVKRKRRLSSAIDRLIAAIFPTWALRRRIARMQSEALEQGRADRRKMTAGVGMDKVRV